MLFKKSVPKYLRAVSRKDVRRILHRIEMLAANPRPDGCEKLTDQKHCRIRQGPCDIIYEVQDDVCVIKVGHRRDGPLSCEQGFKQVIDAVRGEEYAKVTGRERNAIKGLMYLLYIHRGNLRRKDRRRLDEAFKLNRRLFTVYMLQEELRHLWSYTYQGAAVKWFQRW